MNWQASAGTPTGVAGPALTFPALENRLATLLGGGQDDWLCLWCHNRVASERDRFSIQGQSEFAFLNPDGICFEIIIFGQIYGCLQSGKPTLRDTWFPGHAWSFCQCASCEQHLGWFYSGQPEFVGLIKNRIVRALHIRN